jgi:hypothetical protein
MPHMGFCTVCNCSSNVSVKLPRYAPDERLAFVENVCAILIESRFGPGREYELLINLSRNPGPDDCTFFESTPFGIFPSYDYGRVPDSICKQIEADIVATFRGDVLQSQVAAAAAARGSPR